MKSYRKIIIIAAVVVVAGLAVYFIWNWLAASPAAPTTPAPSAPYFPLAGLTATSTAGSSSAANASSSQAAGSGSAVPAGILTKLSDRPAAFFWTDPATGGAFYLDQNGIVWQAEPGQDAQITQQGIPAINFIKPSPDGQSVLAAFGDPRSPSWGIYDEIDQVWRPLPADILNATWGADSNTLIATESNGADINLVSLDLTQSPPKPRVLLNDFRFLDTNLDFLPPATLLISEKGDADYGSRVWSLNLKTLAINLIMGPLDGLEIEPAGSSTALLTYSQSNGFRILNSQTLQNLTPLPFVTLPVKCSTNSYPTVYCFVPTNAGFKDASLPNDYLERRVYSTDALYGIDLATGAAANIPLPTNAIGKLDAKKPVFAGGNLYFVNRFDGYLYVLGLGAS